MNMKIDFDDVISLLATKSGKDRSLCESFLKELIKTFNTQLLAGESISIEGLGVFKLDEQKHLVVNDQSTLGRMFSFYPDSKLIETVNKPFSAFEVTELIDSVSFEDLVSVNELSIDNKTESIEWIEIKEETSPLNEPEVKSILPEEPLIEETHMTQHSVKTNKLELILAGLVLFLFISLSFFIWIIYNNSGYQFQLNTEEDTILSKNEIETDSLAVHTLLLDTAFIEIRSDSTNQITDKSLLKLSDSLIIADSIPKVKTVAEKYIATEVIIKGSTLTALALKYYDHKIFWVYIYEANKTRIDDPNNIRIGTEIKLPMPETYDIDARNKNSRLKAIQKQKELLE